MYREQLQEIRLFLFSTPWTSFTFLLLRRFMICKPKKSAWGVGRSDPLTPSRSRLTVSEFSSPCPSQLHISLEAPRLCPLPFPDKANATLDKSARLEDARKSARM